MSKGKYRHIVPMFVALAIVACCLGLLALSGCASTTGKPVASGSTVTQAGKAAEKAGKVGKPRTTPKPTIREDGTIPFGESFRYDDGLIVTVSKPKKTFVGEWDGREGYSKYVRFTVVVENTGKKAFDPSLMTINMTAGENEGADTYTGEDPSTNILPGKKAKWVKKFGVKKIADLVIQIEPSWDHKEAIWR
jgi:hypothetical protein